MMIPSLFNATLILFKLGRNKEKVLLVPCIPSPCHGINSALTLKQRKAEGVRE